MNMLTIKRRWESFSVATKLGIPIQVIVAVILFFAHIWVMNNFKTEILDEAQQRAEATVDGVINGMNMLMVTGAISNPQTRQLFIKKMNASEKIKELRIIRAKQVQDQFGVGLAEEQALDFLDRQAIETKRTQFLSSMDHGTPVLRVVEPFIASENYRGTNCLSCHNVKAGSVIGATSITLDLTPEFNTIDHTWNVLFLGHIALQAVLFFAINWLIRRRLQPLEELQSSMESLRIKGNMDQFVPIAIKNNNPDEIGKLTDTFNKMSLELGNSEKSMRLATSIYETNADGILVTDENNIIIDVNPAFTRITGYTSDEVVGKNPKILKSGHHDEQFYKQMWQTILNEGSWQGVLWDKRKNSEEYISSTHISTIHRADGSIYRFVAQLSDITDKKRNEDLIYFQANHDLLTGLPNRRNVNDTIKHALAASSRSKDCGAVMFVDLDKFKTINDLMGHAYGDLLLVEIAKRLRSSVREVDTVARLGGDEFLVLIESIGSNEESAMQKAAQIANVICMAINKPFLLNDKVIHISSSIGVSTFCGKDESMDSLIQRADMAMYHAKESGRNTVQFFDPVMQELVEKRAELEADLRQAIANQQFELYYQVQVDNCQKVFGVEALIRWNHPLRGLVMPAHFIPFAEESTLILGIGTWVLETACKQISAWGNNEQTRHLSIAINVSAQQFQQADFVEQVSDMIQKYKIVPARLKLELTESMALDKIGMIVSKMSVLKNTLGVRLSLDDFGTGYSSLSYLKQLPVDQIKIDQSFVRDLTTNISDEVMVKTIIDMAHNFNLDVIAEGVETQSHAAILEKHGCLSYQGYLFGKPLPIEKLEAYIFSQTCEEVGTSIA